MSAALLSLDAVRKRYRQDVQVLDGASLAVEAGDFVGIHGPRRSGRSTVLRLAAGIDLADAGTVSFDGHDLARLSAARRALLRRREIGFVPALPSVDSAVAASSRCSLVLDHVALARIGSGDSPAVAREEAANALRSVDAADCGQAHPHELSSDESTRVALARALVRRPRLLLVDEPAFTGMGDDDRSDIAILLESLARRDGLTLVVASSDRAVLRGARHVLSVAEGRITPTRAPGRVVPFPRRPTEP